MLKVIQRVYHINPEIQEVTDAALREVCAIEDVSPKKVFFISLFLRCCLYHNGCSRRKINQKLLKTQITVNGNSSGYIKNRRYLVVIMWLFSFYGSLDLF